jgi:hypothetical protein
VAEATTRELGRLSLDEALELTILIAQKEPQRLPRVAARWLLRYLEERDPAMDEAAMVAARLAGLAGTTTRRRPGHFEPSPTRHLAEAEAGR